MSSSVLAIVVILVLILFIDPLIEEFVSIRGDKLDIVFFVLWLVVGSLSRRENYWVVCAVCN